MWKKIKNFFTKKETEPIKESYDYKIVYQEETAAGFFFYEAELPQIIEYYNQKGWSKIKKIEKLK